MKTRKVIIHNSVSLDGSIRGFDVDMQAHYAIAGNYKADVHLIGSNSHHGHQTFCPEIPKEEPAISKAPTRQPAPYGSFRHNRKTARPSPCVPRFDLCRDIVVLVSQKTPRDYLRHLEERNYNYHIVGDHHIHCPQALNLLTETYHAQTILTDTGPILNGVLLNNGLVDELSLLVHPVIVGPEKYPLLGNVTQNITLSLLATEKLPTGKIWLTFKCH